MFKNPFSFNGRIRRQEYALSYAIYIAVLIILSGIIGAAAQNSGSTLIVIFFVPIAWFLLAQGAKRCHDIGNSGWYQLIPLYIFVLLFQKGNIGQNRFGNDPKGGSGIGSGALDEDFAMQEEDGTRPSI